MLFVSKFRKFCETYIAYFNLLNAETSENLFPTLILPQMRTWNLKNGKISDLREETIILKKSETKTKIINPQMYFLLLFQKSLGLGTIKLK